MSISTPQAAQAPIDKLATAIEQIPEADLFDPSVPAEFLPLSAQRPFVTICSIYPRDLISKPYTHGRGLKNYRIAAGSFEKPKYLKVYNTYMMLMATTQVDPDSRPENHPRTVIAQDIARDLAQEWGGDHPANRQGHIGIGIIAGETATPQELQALKLAQDNFARAMVNKADLDHANNTKGANYEAARFWADYLGVRDPKAHAWYRIHEPKSYQKCPFCAEEIVTEATACKNCSKDLVEAYLLKNDVRVDLNIWPEVRRVVGLMRPKGAPVGGAPAQKTA